MICMFFFNDTATTEIYTLSLHDALPISARLPRVRHLLRGGALPLRGLRHGRLRHVLRLLLLVAEVDRQDAERDARQDPLLEDRKSTRLNSSHANISYAVFCLKKKNNLHT